PMSKTIVFHHAAEVLTLAGPEGPRAGAAMRELGRIADGSVVARDGRIAWVGPTSGLDRDALSGAEVVDCRGKTVMPALVDAHTHLVWAGDRRDELEMRLGGADYEAIFAAGGGILSSVRQTRAIEEDELFAQSLRRIARMQRTGTT